jgi:hypothetical protein
MNALRRWLAAIAVLAALATAGHASTAAVAEEVRGGGSVPRYVVMACPQPQPGGIDNAWLTGVVDPFSGSSELALDLTIVPCHPVCVTNCAATVVFMVGLHRQLQIPAAYYIPYANLTPQHTVRVRFNVSPGLGAVCLHNNGTIKLDCVAVLWPNPGQPPVVGPHIPVTDPLVSQPLPRSAINGPGCPVCWD